MAVYGRSLHHHSAYTFLMDHDLRFKTLIREFFVEFLRLFFGLWADRLD